MAGSFGFRKTVKKATHWWRHGKRKDRVALNAQLVRESEQRHRAKLKEPMYSTIQEALAVANEERKVRAAKVNRTQAPRA